LDACFSFDIEVRCVQCGADRQLPEGKANRVLEGDAIYADLPTRCDCGAKRVRVDVLMGDEGSSSS